MTTYRTTERLIFNNSLRRLTKTNRKIVRLYSLSLTRIEESISMFYINYDAEDGIDESQAIFLEQLQHQVVEELRRLDISIKRVISNGFKNNYVNTYYQTGFNIEREINIGKGFRDLTNDYILNYSVLPTDAIKAALTDQIAGHTFLDRLKRDRDVLQFKIREEVFNALTEGLSPRQLASRFGDIDDIFAINKNKAFMTARTELLRAYSLGQDASVQHGIDAGVEFTYSWSATLDDRTRADHIALDKKNPNRIEEDGTPIFIFPSGGETSSPRLSGIAKQDINCRCRRLNQPFDIEPTARVTKLPKGTWETQPSNASYNDWLANLDEVA